MGRNINEPLMWPSAICLNLGGVEASRKVTGLVALDPQNIYDVYDQRELSPCRTFTS